MSNDFSNDCLYWTTNFARTEEFTKCVPVQSDGWNGGEKFDFFLEYQCNEEGTEISFNFQGEWVLCTEDGSTVIPVEMPDFNLDCPRSIATYCAADGHLYPRMALVEAER